MGTKPFDEDNTSPIIHRRDKAIGVAFDIEDHSVSTNNTGMSIIRFHVG
jgi:hypothetical protein